MERQTLTINGSRVPAVMVRPMEGAPARRGNPLVILLHGLGAAKEIQEKELVWLARAGFTGVTIDAPHHGERRTSFLAAIDAEPPGEKRQAMIIGLVREAAGEIPHLVHFFRDRGHAKVAVAGISLGGYTAFGAVLRDPLPDVLVPLLASPDWGAAPSPHLHPERFAKLPTLAVVAGKDDVVPPGPCRLLFAALKKKYKKRAGALQLQEYPESGHFMREEDWNDAWERIIGFLDRHL